MELFNLLGTISIDTSDAIENIKTLMAQVDDLESSIDNISQSLNISTSDSGSGTSSGTSEGTKTDTKKSTDKKADEDALTDEQKAKRDANSVLVGNIKTQLVNYATELGKDFLQAGWDYNMQMDGYQKMLETYLQADEETAKKYLEELHKFAIDTPLSMAGTMEQALMLLATGTEAEDLTQVLSMIGDLSGGNMEKFGRVATAYWQIMSDSVLLAQDANQLTEAGVPIYEMIADYFNEVGRNRIDRYDTDPNNLDYNWDAESVRALSNPKSVMSNPNSQVSSEEVLAAFMMATSEGGRFYNAMSKYMESGPGQIEKLKDQTAITSGELLKPLYELMASGGFEVITNGLIKLASIIEYVYDSIADALPEKKLTAEEYTMKLRNQGFSDDQIKNDIEAMGKALQPKEAYELGYITYDEYEKRSVKNDEELGYALDGMDKLSADIVGFFGGDMAKNGFLRWLGYEQTSKGWRNDGETDYFLNSLVAIGDFLNGQKSIENNLPGLFGYDKTDEGWKLYEPTQEELEEDVPYMLSIGDLFKQFFDEVKQNITDPESNDYLRNFIKDTNSTEPSNENAQDDDYKYIRNQIIKDLNIPTMPDGLGGDAGNGNLIGQISSLLTAISEMPSQVSAAVADGMSGITITGNITTGNVMLNTGALVGTLAPSLNLRLGVLNNRSGRG